MSRGKPPNSFSSGDAPPDDIKCPICGAWESRVANLLMEGKTLDESCQQLAIRRSTGRTHIQHLFENVGVKRQSELVSVLWKSVGLVRTKRSNKEEGKSRPTKRAGLNDVLFRMLVNRAFPGVDGIEK